MKDAAGSLRAVTNLTDVIPDRLRDAGTLLTDDEFYDAERPVHCNGVHVGYIPRMVGDLPIGAARVRVVAVVCAGCDTREEIADQPGA